MTTYYLKTTGSDSNAGTSSGSPLLTPGYAASLMAGGDLLYWATGTYTTTSASTNVTGGLPSFPAGSASGTTRVIGTDGSFSPLTITSATTQPKIVINTGSSLSAITVPTNCLVQGVSLDGQSGSNIKGFSLNNSSILNFCRAYNCTNNAYYGNTFALLLNCYASGCSSATTYYFCFGIGCVASGNSTDAFGTGIWIFCIADNNSGTFTDAFTNGSGNTVCVGCVAGVPNGSTGRHGFNFANSSSITAALINCYAEGFQNGSVDGYTAGGSYDAMFLWNCAGYNNATNYNGSVLTAANIVNFQALGASGVTSLSGGNYTPGTGSGLIAEGIPGPFPVLSTTSYSDIGASQHQSVGGSSGVKFHPGMQGGARG